MAKVSLRAYNREIEAITDRGQLDEAIAHCLHILKTFPKHLETYRLLGKAFLEYKRYKDAVDIFTRVLVVEPNDFVANVGMSIIRDEENKLDDAIWHMERAFEVQPSNAAIQGELQRLYGRREGVQPPRIRMTRGALAHMYVQGELYPQAISEIKGVLAEDAGRTDLQVLMARAYFRSGQKNDAADTASAVLRRYPYCLDANRILVEILGVDRPENSQLYRQRVIELDPYAAQVSGTIFQTSEVGDAAVTLDHLEWDGKSTMVQDDWRSPQGINLDSGFGTQATQSPQAQPDWLTNGGFADATPPQPTPTVVPSLPAAAPSIDFLASTPPVREPEPAPAQPTPEAEIPDFLRAAGWGESTGTFDESKMSSFADEPVAPVSASDALPIEQGDMPDWLKAMAPPQVTQPEVQQPAEAEDEPLPDWINNIGKGTLSTAAVAASSNEFDWLNPAEETSQPQAQASNDQPDWMKQLDQPAAQSPTPNDQPDWLTGFGSESDSTPASATLEDQADWMKQFGNPAEDSVSPIASSTSGNDFDFLNELLAPSTPASPAISAPIDAGNIGANQPESADLLAWLGNLEEPAASEQPLASQPPVANTNDLGTSQSEIDDLLAWLENLAAKQGATEGLLVKPEDRMDKEPDWVSKIKGTVQPPIPEPQQPVAAVQPTAIQPPVEQALVQPPTEEIPAQPVATPPIQQPVVNTADLGTSQSEIDDSLAWLENLAAKQGATEGLLVKPEDRMDKEPDWIAKIKGTTPPPAPDPQRPAVPAQPPVEQAPVQPPVEEIPAQPVANATNPGTSQSEIDDSLAWLENLAAKQGATEGLLVKPEDRKDKEPDWIAKIKASSQPPTPEPQQPVVAAQPPVEQTLAQEEMSQQPVANTADLGTSQSEIDDSLAWLENLAAKQGATEGLLVKPEDRMDKEPDWIAKIKASSQAPVPEPQQPVVSAQPTIVQPPVEPAPVQPPVQEMPAQPVANPADPGMSQSEIDDSLAWLENLAAKQGATEGLLVKPEDRKDKEPDWIAKIKGSTQTATPEPQQPTVPAQQDVQQPVALEQTVIVQPPVQETQPPIAPVQPPVQETPQPVANTNNLGTSQSEIDDSLAWLESLAAKQGATEGLLVKPEDRMDKEPDWVTQAKSAPVQPAMSQPPVEQSPVQAQPDVAQPLVDVTPIQQQPVEQPVASEQYPSSADDTAAWLRSLDEEDAKSEQVSANDETAMWFKKLDQPEATPAPAPQVEQPTDDLPAWLKGIKEEQAPVAESVVPANAAPVESDWMNAIEEHPAAVSEPAVDDENLPSWLKGMDEESKISTSSSQDDLPAWMRDETGEVVAEPTKIEPTRATDWHPVEEKQPEPQPVVQEQAPMPVAPVQETPKPAPVKKAAPKPTEVKPATPPAPYREPLTQRGTGMLTMPIDPTLGSARAELARSNVPGAMETYEKLIKKGRLLDEVIFDLREALNRFPVEISILQALGDAYMRANRLQDALDAYTKAEELLR